MTTEDEIADHVRQAIADERARVVAFILSDIAMRTTEFRFTKLAALIEQGQHTRASKNAAEHVADLGPICVGRAPYLDKMRCED